MCFIYLVTWIGTGNNKHFSVVGPHLLPDLHTKRVTSDSTKWYNLSPCYRYHGCISWFQIRKVTFSRKTLAASFFFLQEPSKYHKKYKVIFVNFDSFIHIRQIYFELKFTQKSSGIEIILLRKKSENWCHSVYRYIIMNRIDLMNFIRYRFLLNGVLLKYVAMLLMPFCDIGM
jgi:hypothetical protein